MTESPSTGHDGLDEKRLKILMALRKVRELHEEGLRGEGLTSLINDALDYIDACLNYEERLLAAIAWQGLDAHRAAHDRWREAARKMAAGGMNRAGDGAEFLDFAEKWWKQHLAEDNSYRKALEEANLL